MVPHYRQCLLSSLTFYLFNALLCETTNDKFSLLTYSTIRSLLRPNRIQSIEPEPVIETSHWAWMRKLTGSSTTLSERNVIKVLSVYTFCKWVFYLIVLQLYTISLFYSSRQEFASPLRSLKGVGGFDVYMAKILSKSATVPLIRYVSSSCNN